MTVKQMRDLLATSVSLILLVGAQCLAQPDFSARIDQYIKAEMRLQHIPGLSLAVVRDGKIALLRSYGFSNVEHQIPVKPETVFQSGSIGKQFTAAAVMILAEEGKLSLEDKISRYFPDAPESWKNITVRHLLTHTSGMGEYPPDLDTRRDYTEDEYLTIIKSVPLAYATGSKWDYSNLGYITLGVLIRRVTGKFYGDVLAERVFQPLGMTTARVISEADIVPNRAAGYRLVAGKLKNQEWVSPSTNTTADGSLYFTILDLAKWDAALYTDKLIKQSSRLQMWTPVKLDDGHPKAYGFGWHTDLLHGRRIVFHGGAWQGFKSFIVRFPDDKLSIIFLANSWETKDFKLARGLAAMFFPEFTLPSVQPIEDKEPQVTASVRGVLLKLARGTAEPGSFTPEAWSKLFPDPAKQIGERLNSMSLPIAIIHTNELIERREENGLRIYRYAMNDLGSSLFCTVRLTKDEKIASLQLSSE
jgi:CubicO group peptidase (beta-lactamase class C family)